MSLALYRRLSLLVGLSAISPWVSSQSIERIVYASVLDSAGRPVTNVDPKDLLVRENNVDRHVLQVSRATEPLDIAVLVYTSQDAEPFVPDFRRAVLDFLRAMSDRHEIALMTFGQRPRTVSTTRAINNGLQRVSLVSLTGTCRPSPRGSQHDAEPAPAEYGQQRESTVCAFSAMDPRTRDRLFDGG